MVQKRKTLAVAFLLNSAYSEFSFFVGQTNQCEQLTINYRGSWTAPISYLLVPSNAEASNTPDLIADYNRDYDSDQIILPSLGFPEGTEFTITLSDASGFGSAGTSSILKTGQGNSNSCLYDSPASWTFYNDPEEAKTCEWMEFGIAQKNNTIPYSYYAISPGTMPRTIKKNLTSNNETVAYQITEPVGTQLVFVALEEESSQYNHGGSSPNQVVSRGKDTSCSSPPKPSPRYSDYAKEDLKERAQKTRKIVAGSVVGGVALWGAVAVGIFFYIRRYKRRIYVSNAKEVEIGQKPESADIDEFEPEPYVHNDSITSPTNYQLLRQPISPTTGSTTPSKFTSSSMVRNCVYHEDAGSFHEEDQHIPPPYADR
ncbi:hypothetical protein E3Q23_03675 [Wallemia mellicola]|uniref:Uncharacterized protein n=1 Tax=Wallemia mellicola TaxID=1708541 RepID=A0A4T0R6W0_9BASI|nr:hypothetical protein E3Q24_03625 [Wallemia mellicola]TIB71726.1 hypothetical protein E3Q23_03675 [Wallemia mellicola]TIB80521.1 hypothetical protein E3Q21_03727 [Wallemia mellicola]TIB84527.1 hypothetical protein E3Q20_03624 [Wallemia mellicola]TIB96707.1 hypothetical protein E3Q17_03708 [Wallemia mellicola]